HQAVLKSVQIGAKQHKYLQPDDLAATLLLNWMISRVPEQKSLLHLKFVGFAQFVNRLLFDTYATHLDLLPTHQGYLTSPYSQVPARAKLYWLNLQPHAVQKFPSRHDPLFDNFDSY